MINTYFRIIKEHPIAHIVAFVTGIFVYNYMF
jgi:hypothetical protein